MAPRLLTASLAALVLASLVCLLSAEPFKLVLFYDPDDGLLQDVAFKSAIRHFNHIHEHAFKEVLVSIKGMDSFKISKEACNLASEGVVAFFGPHDVALAATVASVARLVEVPHIAATWEAELPPGGLSVNLYPKASELSEALAQVMRALHWRSYTIVYAEEASLIRLQGIIQAREPSDIPTVIRRLDPSGDYRPMLKQMKHNSEMRMVLDSSPETAQEILGLCRDLGMLGVYHSFFLTNLDSHTVDLSEFRVNGTNITTVRLMDPRAEQMMKSVAYWVDMERMHNGRFLDITPNTVKAATALIYDAAYFYYRAVTHLNGTHAAELAKLPEGGCSTPGAGYQGGLLLHSFLKETAWPGLTGDLQVDSSGQRKTVRLHVVELTRDGFNNTGLWTTEDGFVNVRSAVDLETQITETLQSRTIIVTSRIGEPFLRFKEPRDPAAQGNDQFEGYSMDLIAAIARILEIKFEFRLVPDGQYGTFDAKKQKWNGLLGELLDRRADLAICDLTITFVRETAVDFTMPFMNLGISILYKKLERKDSALFSFLEPFSPDVWLYMVTAYLGVSLLLFVLARANPNQWDSPHPCVSDPDELENNFNMVNCLWFSLGSLMGQGCDILPRAVSTRMVAGMWWFFTLIMISSYTANLAAFLTVNRMDDTIKNVEDLAKQTKIKYGTFGSGSTAAFFRDSNNSLYQRMWTVMTQARPNVFTSGNKEGVERVKKGKGDYAFFMESTTIEYEIRKNCDLVKVGGQLDSKGYGIAMPPGSPFRKKINGAILKLQEKGTLKVLKDRWWRDNVPDGCAGQVTEKAAVESSAELDLSNVGGVFLVLFFGCAAAFIVAILEFLWNSRKIAVEEKITPVEAMISELKFAVDCRADTKPVKKKSGSDDGADDGPDGSFLHLQMNYDTYHVDPTQ